MRKFCAPFYSHTGPFGGPCGDIQDAGLGYFYGITSEQRLAHARSCFSWARAGPPGVSSTGPFPLLEKNGLLDLPDLHKGIADQMSRVSRLVSFADSHRA